jgi:phage terminase large subunit-like protein
MMAANRVGKTESVGLYEVSLHLTGRYPDWWTGKRFDHPVKVWIAGDTSQTVRDILQEKLLGPPGEWGTGVLPGEFLVGTPRPKGGGVPDAIESFKVNHLSGGISRGAFKSYDQKRKSFQGTEQHIILLDEEPPADVHSECLIRTMTTKGHILCTFTPLMGRTEVVKGYVKAKKEGSETKILISAGWDDVPHLSEEEKAEYMADLRPFEIKARTKGLPELGPGAIYPVDDADILVKPFDIPAWWPRAYGMDVGWKKTAAIWGAIDRESDVLYLYSEHYQGYDVPVVHAAAIKARGAWIPGVIDPASNQSGQIDGEKVLEEYLAEDLDLEKAVNAREAGLLAVWQRMRTGRLKVFNDLRNWRDEKDNYARDENGKVVKEDDHLMDAMRYLVMSGLDRAAWNEEEYEDAYSTHQSYRNQDTGY